ncbi:DUF1294 domain-containing protein [uncultured Thomasclavelia sp.]|uniref:DUF1294 domain-containing protein n=1 Tax=uncultured Thomasclavelia sp. TaxID=3025759 RepID=UPI0025E23F1E|nr:DUF1294 domain-containing protein [uncultured Thomasclavelia sp.]
MKIELIYLLAINLFTIIIYAVDKYKAKHHRWRIPEKTLLCLAIIGGSPGALLAMYLFRHKTQKVLFKWGIPLIIGLQIILILIIKDMGFNLMSDIPLF